MSNPPTSTTSGASGSPTKKNSIPAKDYSHVENCRDITIQLLRYFPFLQMAPDIDYWLMATWGAESSWRLFHKKKDGSYNSIHHTACNPDKSSLIGRGYQYSNIISNLWNNPSTTLATKNNIKEGWYAHGITACMGTYHVRGCPNNKGEWRRYPEAVKLIDLLGLEVEPGESISQKLFPTDDDICRQRSIASGMIIFNAKYRGALERGQNPVNAVQTSVGNFLGKAGAKDENGTTPEARIRQLNATKGDIQVSLMKIGVVPSGQRGELGPYLIDLADKQAKDRAATRVENVAARGATTNGGSNGKSASVPGCST